jgi:hypothetical protein
MRIKPTDSLQIYASADASYGPFSDGKSNTGFCITVGMPNAPIIVKSQKQKTVSNSSTAAELVAMNSAMEEVIWLIQLFEDLGYKQEPVFIEQDNMSTIRLTEKGPTGQGRTIHEYKVLLVEGTLGQQHSCAKVCAFSRAIG